MVADNLQFRVETLVVRDGAKEGRIRPNDKGYYENVPIAVLNEVTRNNTFYDIPSMMEQIESPKSKFNERLVKKQLYGEWGHPKLYGMRPEEQLARMVDIDESRWSHHIYGVYAGRKLESTGGTLLCATLKPTGPFKTSLEDNLNDPCMNTAFSLRAITSNQQRGNVSYRVVRKLVTFDAVGAGGYEQAAKFYSASVECMGGEDFNAYDLAITDEMNPKAVFTQYSVENFTDTELNDLFSTNSVAKVKKIQTVMPLNERRRGPGFGRFLRSTFHERIKE